MNSLNSTDAENAGRSIRELLDREYRRGARDFQVSRDDWQMLYRAERTNAGVSVVAEGDRAFLVLPAFGEWMRVEALADMGGASIRWERQE